MASHRHVSPVFALACVLVGVVSSVRPYPATRSFDDEARPSEWKRVDVYVGPPSVLGKRGEQHSQVGQDWLVASLLGCKRNGTFIDIAANDAKSLSNSLMLERDFEWTGACIEANMDYVHQLSHRRCMIISAAVGTPKDAMVDFTMKGVFGGIVGSGFDNKVKSSDRVESFRLVPLAEILERARAPPVLDYLSLDVEGAESIVMKGFPWEKYRFRVITVERPKPDLRQQLQDHGYRFLRKNSHFNDQTWISTDLPDFASIMSTWSDPSSKPPGAADSCMIEMGYPQPSRGSLAPPRRRR